MRRGKSILALMLLVVMSTFLVGFDGRSERGDLSRLVWYYGELVPFGVLLDNGVVPQCHDGLGPGIITCYDTREELAAATGVDLAGVDKTAVEQLNSTDAVAQVQPGCYARTPDTAPYVASWGSMHWVGMRGSNFLHISGTMLDDASVAELARAQIALHGLSLDKLDVTTDEVGAQTLSSRLSTKDVQSANEAVPGFMEDLMVLPYTLNTEHHAQIVICKVEIVNATGEPLLKFTRDDQVGRMSWWLADGREIGCRIPDRIPQDR